ncbi:helix-turn-helix transcriptional regulator [Dinoroseobacter sp. S76]|uniref:helix-turn-helix transcriptional regulator n=1 Tax=Dinoroseobacter sp. S76 TaxID=3415124 RepID=UPI003C7AA463
MSADDQETAPGFHIRQYRRARFDRLISPSPAVIRVEAGEKRLSADGCTTRVEAGALVLLPEATPLLVENLPLGGMPYAATVLAVPRPLFEAAYARLGEGAVRKTPPLQSCLAMGAVAQAFITALTDLRRAPTHPRSQLSCEALALEMALAGAWVSPAPVVDLAAQLRTLLAADLAAPWTAETAARRLGLSPATLRRRLRVEGQSFQEILRELRLASGLHLLQTTRWPVASVAEAVGYRSASRFASRFQARFALSPRDLRRPVSIKESSNDR